MRVLRAAPIVGSMPPLDVFRAVADALVFSPDKMKKNSLFASERFFCDIYAFEPGQSQKGHRHADSDKIYYVLEGAGEFQVDQRSECIGPGVAIYCPAGSEHAVRNPGPDRLAVLVFMAPPPK